MHTVPPHSAAVHGPVAPGRALAAAAGPRGSAPAIARAPRRSARRAAALVGLLLGTTAVAEPPAATLRDLAEAYGADLNAQARHAAFAARASAEGYEQVARLFRAAARSEEIRARNHARSIRRLGAEPRAAIAPVEVRSTRQNLLATLAHEGAERATGYPRFARQARRDGDLEAALGFTLAHAAERELVRLFQDALARLERLRAARDPLHVCGTCGHVAVGEAPDTCPVSLSPADAFTRVD